MDLQNRWTALLLLILLTATAGYGQTNAPVASEKFFTGKVIDAASREPIPFVYVLFSQAQDRGVLTNENGDFSLPYQPGDEADVIIISHIGYKRFAERFVDLQATADAAGEVTISLESQYVRMPVVTVRANWEPEFIVREAVKRIPDNYGVPEFQTNAYYRQYGLQNGVYTDVTEAFVTIRDHHYVDPNRRSDIFVDYLDRKVYDRDRTSDDLYKKENPIYSLYEKQNNSARFHQLNWMAYQDKDFYEIFDFNLSSVYMNQKDTIAVIKYRINPERAGMSKTALRTLSGWTRGEAWINLSDFAIIRNSRGDENGNVFSEAYYVKLGPKYFPSRITSVYAIQQGRDDYFVCNRMLCFSSVTNDEDKMRYQIEDMQKMNRKKTLGEFEFRGVNRLNAKQKLLQISAPAAAALHEARKAFQLREQAGE